MLSQLLGVLSLLVSTAQANTEKTIFLGPSPVNVLATYPALADLYLDVLTPDNFTIRTFIKSEFPQDESDHGRPSWLILNELNPGQRYEVRVCWAATQPTAFRLQSHNLEAVLNSPVLSAELMEYSLSRSSDDEVGKDKSFLTATPSTNSSILLLQILAAADYYTTNQTLMQDPPPVFVDIILDPFLLNALPRSLLPIAIYVVALAVVSWYVGTRVGVWISNWIRQEVITPSQDKKDQ
ncbi:hypothetical protein F5Y16DRAFT_108421 [Xylariaceae sp. FL0255]|nr:hypothetical protein F5Y16DRAFT_108421 [Xylariaceae sp. FL0255]